MGRSVSCPKAVWSSLSSLPSQVIWGCSERTVAGTQETWTLLCLLCLLKSLSLLPHPLFLVSFFMHEVTSGSRLDEPRWEVLCVPARWARLPAEHGETLAVVPAGGSDGSQGHSSPEGCHPPLPGAAGLGLGLPQGQGHALALKTQQGDCQDSLFCCWAQPSLFEVKSLKCFWFAGGSTLGVKHCLQPDPKEISTKINGCLNLLGSEGRTSGWAVAQSSPVFTRQ